MRQYSLLNKCEAYLQARTGKYEWRQIRYRAALSAMRQIGLCNEDTVFDVGAGWTEFDYLLRREGDWRGRYVPVDGAMDGTDLNSWRPPRQAEYFVCLETLEHLRDPGHLACMMRYHARKGVIVSTPNPSTTDALGMDSTHVTPISAETLMRRGFTVTPEEFYGKRDDSLFGVWRRYS